MLIAVYELARVCADDDATALLAAVVCGTTPDVPPLRPHRHDRRPPRPLGHDRQRLPRPRDPQQPPLARLPRRRRRAGPRVPDQRARPPRAVARARSLVFVAVDHFRNRDRRRPAVGPWIAPITIGLLLMLAIAAPVVRLDIRRVPEGDRLAKPRPKTRRESLSPFLPASFPTSSRGPCCSSPASSPLPATRDAACRLPRRRPAGRDDVLQGPQGAVRLPGHRQLCRVVAAGVVRPSPASASHGMASTVRPSSSTGASRPLRRRASPPSPPPATPWI